MKESIGGICQGQHHGGVEGRGITHVGIAGAFVPGLGPESADAQVKQESATDQLGPEGVAHEQAGDEGETEGPHAAIERIRRCRPQSREQAQKPAFCESAADHQHADGAHRRRDGETYDETPCEQFDAHFPILRIETP
jgi:hypothetical protein